MNESLWTLAFEFVNFLTVAALLSWWLFRPVRKTLDEHRSRLAQGEQDIAQRLTEVKVQQQELEQLRRKLVEEREAGLNQAREEAAREANRIKSEAQAEIEKQWAAFRRDRLRSEEARVAELARMVAKAAAQAVQELLSRAGGPGLDSVLAEAAIRQLREDDGQGPFTITAARPLDASTRQLLTGALGRSSGDLEFRTDPGLLGGLTIMSRQGLIDASVGGLGRYTQKRLTEEMDSQLAQVPGDD